MGVFFKKKSKQNDYKQNNTLANLGLNKSAKIVGYDKLSNIKTKRRLLELGFIIGATVAVSNVSIMQKVMLVQLNGYMVSLRTDIAKTIQVGNIK
ncbi:MAG: ferrous iron transport protein A [Clostridiales bacterium]|nr:ferrous iron transport protein A [Clostridiales bacterium]